MKHQHTSLLYPRYSPRVHKQLFATVCPQGGSLLSVASSSRTTSMFSSRPASLDVIPSSCDDFSMGNRADFVWMLGCDFHENYLHALHGYEAVVRIYRTPAHHGGSDLCSSRFSFMTSWYRDFQDTCGDANSPSTAGWCVAVTQIHSGKISIPICL